MHVGGLTLDLNWLLQFIFTSFVIALGFLRLVKNTAVKYFEVDSSFDGDRSPSIQGGAVMDRVEFTCANCGDRATKRCSRCKSVRYCSSECQLAHWKSEHKSKCRDCANLNTAQNSKLNGNVSVTALIPSRGISKLPIKKPREVLFPYDEFIELYNWDKQVFPPCGLLNCGNSCFANVVLQCLTYTRPLIAYLLEKGHRKECRREDWCFLCEFEMHVERASRSSQLFSPISILSHLPSIGGNLGHGRQEDAHEFMRFAIDRMQSVCLDEFGGERAVSPTSQETTLIQHIFGGHLQSQVICTKCNNISKQLENIMDLTVEIHGDVESLGECLDQFTVKEWLHGDNMYKCDGCNDYVNASKQLTIRRAPNILTIALKRFQSGRFGKLNKRVAFPGTLDLSPYMSDGGDGTDIYKLYGVIVHVDMLNASFFGHYICYTKDFSGNWYRIDDCKVLRVELDDVLCQSAYMLLYSRVSVPPSCLRTAEAVVEKGSSKKVDEELSTNQAIECSSPIESKCDASTSEPQAAGSDAKPIPIHPEAGVFKENSLSEAAGDLKCHEDIDSVLHSNSDEDDTSVTVDGVTVDENLETMDTIDSDPSLPFPMEISDSEYDAMKGQTYHDQRSRVDRYTLYDDNKSNKYMKMNGNAHGFSTDTTPAIRQRS